MDRRNFLKTTGAVTVLTSLNIKGGQADVPDHRWDGYDFGPGPFV